MAIVEKVTEMNRGADSVTLRLESIEVPDNASGVVPLEFKVLVIPAKVEEDKAFASAKAAGIVIAQETEDSEHQAQMVATFVAAGGNAFEDWKDETLPKAGDRVWVAKYQGVRIRGADGQEYRLMNDKDVAALIVADGVSRAI